MRHLVKALHAKGETAYDDDDVLVKNKAVHIKNVTFKVAVNLWIPDCVHTPIPGM